MALALLALGACDSRSGAGPDLGMAPTPVPAPVAQAPVRLDTQQQAGSERYSATVAEAEIEAPVEARSARYSLRLDQ